MSGIAAIYHVQEHQRGVAHIAAMAQTLTHRGPDGSDVWSDDHAALACLMLRTTPESLNELLPYYDAEARLAITADARIDNRTELSALLGLPEQGEQPVPDSRFILEAYKKWGTACCEHLIGDYAVVIWDQKEHRIFAFRDHFGVRPLYYCRNATFVAFASEIKALLALPEVPHEINEERVIDFITLQDDRTATFYKDIYTLPPGHWFLATRDTIRQAKYWQLEPGPILKLKRDVEYVEAFREQFTEAVRCRMRRVGSLGSHLSGGLDSSSISCCARELLKENGEEQLHTFSYYFEYLKECDERVYINAIVEQGGINSHFVQADDFPGKELYDHILDTSEEAVSFFNASPIWKINTLAKELGIRIMLDGFDGDSTVSHGTGRLIELARSMRFGKLIREAEGYAAHFGLPKWSLSRYYIARFSPFNPLADYYGRSRKKLKRILRQGGNTSQNRYDRYLANGLLQNYDVQQRYERLKRNRRTNDMSEQSWQTEKLTAPGMQRVLEFNDRCMAHFSMEKRYPFWDKRLIAFCLGLPAAQKLEHGYNRMIMRRAMEPVLPPSVCWRGCKSNLSSHANTLVQKLIGVYNLQNSNINEIAASYVDKNTLKEFFKSPSSKLEGDEAVYYYRIAGLLLWLNRSLAMQVGKANTICPKRR